MTHEHWIDGSVIPEDESHLSALVRLTNRPTDADRWAYREALVHASAIMAEAARLRADAVHWQDEAALLRIERDRARQQLRVIRLDSSQRNVGWLDAALADEPREG